MSKRNAVTLDAWRCHTPSLLKEILHNPTCAILEKPINIFGKMLAQVADRAIELNDPELNALMMRLTLYMQADPYVEGYSDKVYDQVLAEGRKAAEARKKKAKKELTKNRK